eukprot:TRINITY_DN9572_c0_g1_i1.p1 TRINITY_DN9572_c0_g1~~TRINITY_DN9572_c0_g1_i1.p1  ORF type:complete len:365 (-),score=39.35 TRINITY_DN9572_c0_g1_i1:581-1675(-)
MLIIPRCKTRWLLFSLRTQSSISSPMVFWQHRVDHDEMKRHYEFIRHLKASNADIRKTYIRLYDKDYRGLHASKNIGMFEDILSIPMTMTISFENLVSEYDIGKKLLEKNVFNNKWRRFIFPLIYILKELKNPKSKYKAWLNVFPAKADTHPLFFSEEERKWLKGSTTLDKLDDDLKMVKSFYKKIIEIDPKFDTPFEEFLHYYYILCSRYFGVTVNDKKATVLTPYADLINTGRAADKNAYWYYESSTRAFKVCSNCTIKAGEPIMFCYGHNSNFTYFTYYGIALDYPEFDSVCFMLKLDSSVPNHEIKIRLLGLEESKVKRARFYADYTSRLSANMSFMGKLRFYWTEAAPKDLAKVRSSLT